MAKRKQPRRRWVPYYRWVDPESADLWIREPRKIRLSRTWGEVYPDIDGKPIEMVIVQ